MHRALTAAALFALALCLALVSLGPLQNLFSDYQDSPTGTYLLLGLPFAAGAVAAAVAGVWVLRR